MSLDSQHLVITIENEPGNNHLKIMALQDRYGNNWLLKDTADEILLAASEIGAADSTFQGCRWHTFNLLPFRISDALLCKGYAKGGIVHGLRMHFDLQSC